MKDEIIYGINPVKEALRGDRQAFELFISGDESDRRLEKLLKLAADKPAVEELWRGKPATAVYPVNMTPFAEGTHLYAVNTDGDLTAMDMQTGKRLWTTSGPVTGKKKQNDGTAFIVMDGDRYFLFNEMGELIIAKLSPEKYEEISRAKILDVTNNAFGRDVLWTHPAFANKCLFVRNDKEIICVSLAK